ncbi:MAG: YdcH family protein [Acidobacteriota bacterium]|jgi:uncharacterized protein YdcH (DUF465 family)
MELAEPEIRDILLAENEQFRTLAHQHAEYESRLEELSGKHLPSEQERVEEIEIKKHKLQLKDQMAAMIREYRREEPAAVAH